MGSVSDIKLIRTDTTLDLSQKAEKRCRLGKWPRHRFFISARFHVGNTGSATPFHASQ